jgi:DnaJ family protein C protein 9
MPPPDSPVNDDLVVDGLPTIDPYGVLGLERSASADEIKRAYRKAALKNHPDKVPADEKAASHTTFQEIAFAYAVLSDPARRSRYDATGSTAEAVTDVDGFDWTDFYRAQWADVVSTEAIEKVRAEYQGSEEERGDVLAAFEEFEGDLNALFESVMLSNPLVDEDRFRKMIDKAIKKGEVQPHERYTKESKNARKKRTDAAKREEQEAMKMAKEMGVAEKLFSDGKKDGGEEGLMAIIQQRQKSRSESFLDRLEEKYGGNRTKSRKGRGKKQSLDAAEEPSEEMFQKTRAELDAKRKKNKDDEDDDAPDSKGGRKSKRSKGSKQTYA